MVNNRNEELKSRREQAIESSMQLVDSVLESARNETKITTSQKDIQAVKKYYYDYRKKFNEKNLYVTLIVAIAFYFFAPLVFEGDTYLLGGIAAIVIFGIRYTYDETQNTRKYIQNLSGGSVEIEDELKILEDEKERKLTQKDIFELIEKKIFGFHYIENFKTYYVLFAITVIVLIIGFIIDDKRALGVIILDAIAILINPLFAKKEKKQDKKW